MTIAHRSTLVVHGRLAMRESRLAASRDSRHGLQVLSFEQARSECDGPYSRCLQPSGGTPAAPGWPSEISERDTRFARCTRRTDGVDQTRCGLLWVRRRSRLWGRCAAIGWHFISPVSRIVDGMGQGSRPACGARRGARLTPTWPTRSCFRFSSGCGASATKFPGRKARSACPKLSKTRFDAASASDQRAAKPANVPCLKFGIQDHRSVKKLLR